MLVRLPGGRVLEVRKLADTPWRWVPRRSPFPPHWLYWGRFAACLTIDVRHERTLAGVT